MQKSFTRAISFLTVVSVLYACLTIQVLPASAAAPIDSSKVLLNEDFQDYASVPTTVSEKGLKFTYNSNVPGELGTEENGNQYIMAPASTLGEPSVTISPIDSNGTLKPYAVEAGKSYALEFRFKTDAVGTATNPLAAMEYIITFTNGSYRIQPLAITKVGQVQFCALSGAVLETNVWHTTKFIITKSAEGDIVVSGASLVSEKGISYAAGADRTTLGMKQIDSIKFDSARNAGNIMIDDVAFYDISTPEVPSDSTILVDENFETASKIPSGTAKSVTSENYTWTYAPSTNYVAPSIVGDATMGNVLKLGPALSDLNLTISTFALTEGQRYILKYDFMTDSFIDNQFKDLMLLQQGASRDYTLRIGRTDQLISSETVFDTNTANKWYHFEAIITPDVSGMLVDIVVKDASGNVLGTRSYRSPITTFDNIRFATKANGGAVYIDNLQLYSIDDVLSLTNAKIASESSFENTVATLKDVQTASDIYCKFDLEKQSDAFGNPTVILAAFEKGSNSQKLIAINTIDLKTQAAVDGIYTLKTESALFTTEVGKSYEIKVLVWNSLGTVQPKWGVTTIAE